jgi:hypothetical protein
MSKSETAAQIQTLDHKTLTGLMRLALASNTAELTSWGYEAVKGATGAVTGGIYRVVGRALDYGKETPWSVILKIVSAPTPKTPSIFNDIAHPVYWKREVLAYQSGLLDSLPGGLEAVRCLDLVEQRDGSFWLWLEEVKDNYGQCWPLDQYARAARTLGRFNGAYLAGHTMPHYPWLTRDGSPRGTIDAFSWIRDAVQDPKTWEHPLVQSAFPAAFAKRLDRLWEERGQLLDAFERLPNTLCHYDAWRGNLFAPEDADGNHRLIAIDWAFLGKGVVGTDAGDLFSSFGLFRVEPTEPGTLDAVVFENYIDGLREAGWQGDQRMVRFAFATYASLKYSCLIPWLVDALDESRHAFWEEHSGRPMVDLLHNQAALLYYLLDLADEARSLLPSV